MAKPKQLLPLNLLDRAATLASAGVPLTKIHRNMHLDELWSYQSTVDLIKADLAGLHAATRPAWLPQEGTDLVSQPPDWQFRGIFPDGEWVKKKATSSLSNKENEDSPSRVRRNSGVTNGDT